MLAFMPPRLRTAPRKQPTQARATATVEAILLATSRILAREGYDRLSTNRVAEEAGVSVGSLYQYFPSKEALVATLAERHRERTMALVLGTIIEQRDAPPEVAVRAMVRAIIDAHTKEREVHRVLSEQIPRIGKLKDLLDDIEGTGAGAVEAWLELRKDRLRVTNTKLAAWLVSHAVEATVHACVLGEPPASRAEIEDEIVALVLRYLVP